MKNIIIAMTVEHIISKMPHERVCIIKGIKVASIAVPGKAFGKKYMFWIEYVLTNQKEIV